MKLIDKDKLLKELRKYHPISYGIFSDIEYFPTAYDIDNVIKELETEMQKKCPTVCFDDNYEQEIYDAYRQGMYDAFTDAIEIVKKGCEE